MKAIIVGTAVILAATATAMLFTLTRESRIANAIEIREGLATLPANCRNLARARMRHAVIHNGAVSVRRLGVILRSECHAASAQLRAIG